MHEIQLIGVTSMLIASKFEETKPFTLQNIYEKVSHKRIPISEIKRTEAEIMQTLNFEIAQPTPTSLVNLMLNFLGTQAFF